jgi:hypothetical protein
MVIKLRNRKHFVRKIPDYTAKSQAINKLLHRQEITPS